MQKINEKLLEDILEFIEDYAAEYGEFPSVREISGGVNSSKSTVQRYLRRLKDEGKLEFEDNRYIPSGGKEMYSFETTMVNKVGTIKCGNLTRAEQEITESFRFPVSLIGRGEFFLLDASGDSMINAGIDDGDYVLIRSQNYADFGDIVVARVNDETTLKRLCKDKTGIYLHPENEEYDDIYPEELDIQGVAAMILKYPK